MSRASTSTRSSLDRDRISPYTLEEFNKLLEDNKPYTKKDFKNIIEDTIETLENTTLDYNIALKLLICSKCSYNIAPSTSIIIKHLVVSTF